jgi:ABC-type sugar transport system substrate-binding protein
MNKKALAAALITAVAMMSTTPAFADDLNLVFECDKTEGFVIGYSNGYWGNTWRAQMVEDFETRANEYKEAGIIADIMISNTNNDPTEQLNQINAMIDSGVDAIIIDAVSPTTIKSAVEKAQHEGILVVVSNDPAYYEGTICVCGDNYTWQLHLAEDPGRMAGGSTGRCRRNR